MRASSLSNTKVIDLLNHYFVPVNVDGVYLKANAGVAREEKAAFISVVQQFYQLNKENRAAGKPEKAVGSVCLYVLTPEGRALDSLTIGEAQPGKVAELLTRAIRTLKTPEGKALIQPAPQAAAPRASADSLVLHLVARYLVPRGQPNARKDVDDDFVPVQAALGEERSGQWSALPSEDWIVFQKPQWTKLLPSGKVTVGTSWDVDKELARELLVRFYPTAENNDLSTNRLERLGLHVTVVSISKGVARARLTGELKMKHMFYPGRNDPTNLVEANVVGYLDFAVDGSRILTVRLITDRASYGNGPFSRFGVAVESLRAAPNSQETDSLNKSAE
jgi:hypothetical protein